MIQELYLNKIINIKQVDYPQLLDKPLKYADMSIGEEKEICGYQNVQIKNNMIKMIQLI